LTLHTTAVTHHSRYNATDVAHHSHIPHPPAAGPTVSVLVLPLLCSCGDTFHSHGSAAVVVVVVVAVVKIGAQMQLSYHSHAHTAKRRRDGGWERALAHTGTCAMRHIPLPQA
jgi:hypothetical protein